jgi:hypothetical protein
MGQQDDGANELKQVNNFVLLLSGESEPVHYNFLRQNINLIEESAIVDEPSKLSNVNLVYLIVYKKAWDDSNTVGNEESSQIVYSNFFKVGLLFVAFQLEEVQHDVQAEAHINNVLQANQIFLALLKDQDKRS